MFGPTPAIIRFTSVLVPQLVKKIPYLYGTVMFIAAFTAARHMSLP